MGRRRWIGLAFVAVIAAFLSGRFLRERGASVVASPHATTVERNRVPSFHTRSSDFGGTPAVGEGTNGSEPPPPARYFERPASEWQGMLVDISDPQECSVTSDCGMALSCRSGQCLPCTADSHCGGEEVCVLDHCVRRTLAACRTSSDCRPDAPVCILTGYSYDPRGNASMSARCLAESGGSPETGWSPSHLRAPIGGRRTPPEIERRLVEKVR